MEIRPTEDQEEFIRQAIAGGRIAHAEQAAAQAMALWEERERRRAELLSDLDDAEAAIARGEGMVITEQSMQALAKSIKQRGRARTGTEKTAQA